MVECQLQTTNTHTHRKTLAGRFIRILTMLCEIDIRNDRVARERKVFFLNMIGRLRIPE